MTKWLNYIAAHHNQYLLGNSHFMLVALPQNSKVHHVNAWLLSLLDMGIVPIISEVRIITDNYSLNQNNY